jgi:hypothetical protein
LSRIGSNLRSVGFGSSQLQKAAQLRRLEISTPRGVRSAGLSVVIAVVSDQPATALGDLKETGPDGRGLTVCGVKLALGNFRRTLLLGEH